MKKLIALQLLLLLTLPIFFMACSDDDDQGTPQVLLPKLDGFYVYGTNTLASGPAEPGARMAQAKLDPTKGNGQTSMDGVYGKFMYIGANSTITFAEVADEVGTIYGSADVKTENGADAGISVNDNIMHGSLTEDTAPITITKEALYYVFVDMNKNVFVVMEVKANLIGDALIENGWDAGTPLALKSVSKEKTVYEGTNIAMTYGYGYKFRFNDGWAAYADEEKETHSFLGVESYQTAWDNQETEIGFFTDNIPSFELGMYTVTLTYTESTTGGEGVWTSNLEKTGPVLTDYTDTNIGLFGNAYMISGEQGNWSTPYEVKAPTKSGSVYTWTWDNVELVQDGQFVILKNGNWEGGMLFLYSSTQHAGDAFTSGAITNLGDNDNFVVATGGTYDITLTIDAATDTRTVTIQ